MDTIVDLRARGADHEVLTQTEVSGRIRTQSLLAERPLSSYLDADEEPQYVLRNKKSGVEVEQDGNSQAMEPDDDHQALAVVTDLCVRFIIGNEQGDRSAEVAFGDIVQAKSMDQGFRTTALVIETINDRTWSFPCRGDTESVASFVDEFAQTWVSSERRIDEVEEQLETAREQIKDGNFETAAQTVSDVESKLETAIEEMSSVGGAAHRYIRERAEPLASEYLTVRAPISAQLAADAHARAQREWTANNYETAASAYNDTIEGYRLALEHGPESAQEILTMRLRGALRERLLLRFGPLIEADTKRRKTAAMNDPESATSQWQEVLEAYQSLLSLEWPGEGGFVSDTEFVREQASDAAAGAIEDYYEAGRRRLGSADQFAVDGREDRAMVLYERAREQFEEAKSIASEAHPDRVGKLRNAIDTVIDRLSGNYPTERLPDEQLPITELEPAETSSSTEETFTPTAETDTGGEITPVEEDTPSVIGQIQSQKQPETTAENETDQTRPEPGTEITNTEIRTNLQQLDEESFTELVADLWEAQGWSTTVFSATNQVVYDIVAMHESEEQRLLLWTEHRPDDEQIGPRAVERCATARDSSQGADSATLVTNALLRTAAQERADSLDVTIIDGQDLVELLRFEDFLGRLDREAEN